MDRRGKQGKKKRTRSKGESEERAGGRKKESLSEDGRFAALIGRDAKNESTVFRGYGFGLSSQVTVCEPYGGDGRD